MAKPILVARFYTPDQDKQNASARYRRGISEGLNHEYHVMVVFKSEEGSPEFEVHNAENLPTITKETFNQLIEEVNG